MSVFTSTNLGVNKTNPAHTLDVNGDCAVSGNAFFNNLSVSGTFSGNVNTAPATQSLILSYTMNSAFSNGTSKPMYVTLVINASALNEIFTIYCDTNSNPSTQILQISVYSNQQAVSFVLLPNFYFKVNANASGSVTSFIYYN